MIVARQFLRNQEELAKIWALNHKICKDAHEKAFEEDFNSHSAGVCLSLFTASSRFYSRHRHVAG